MAPPAAGAGSNASTPVFRFEVGDEVEVSVWQEKELTTTHRVLRDGTVPARAVGPVRVVGRTIDEVHTELEARYAKFLVEPRVSIKVVSVHAERAFILGEVAKPAAITLGGRMTLMQGIALAGGLGGGADLQTIRVVRSRAGMQPRVFTVNADAMMKGQARSFLLQPGDVVFVHPTGLADWSRRMTLILSPISTALGGLGSIATAAAVAIN
jgi:polysaccharide export outer membrane protein